MPGVGSGPISITLTPAATKPASSAASNMYPDSRVSLPMSTVPPLRREHARGRAGETQREIHRHRMFADAAANAIGAEILTCHRNPLPATTAAATRIASTVAATSWARTIRAPLRTAMAASATLPAVRSSTSRPVSVASIDLRDSPTAIGTPSVVRAAEMFEQHQVVDDAFAETKSRIDGETRRVDARGAARGETRSRGMPRLRPTTSS